MIRTSAKADASHKQRGLSDRELSTPGYFPAGGGIYGTDTTASVLNNGYPSQQSILKLARPIIIPVRQNISVNAEFFAVGTTNVLDIINNAATDDQLCIMFMIDGSEPSKAQAQVLN